jgi:hypothetical protein
VTTMVITQGPDYHGTTPTYDWSTLKSIVCPKTYKSEKVSTLCVHNFSYLGVHSHFTIILYTYSTGLY